MKKEGLDDFQLKEIEEINIVRGNFQHYINFAVYECFFRTFCFNKFVETDYSLRADQQSFQKGIQYWYNGKKNKAFADIVFYYLSKGKLNHLITFSEFIYFIREIQLSEYH